MRGAAMSSTAAASGFVVFLLSVSVVQGQNDWRVTYTSTQICALKGSKVNINCNYRYPSRLEGTSTTVKERFWFTELSNNEPVDLRTDSEYAGRVQYHCDKNDCTLRITDLRESDSAEYKFRFITNQPRGRFTGSPGVILTVTDYTDLQVQVMRSPYNPSRAEMKCHSSCRLPDRSSYIWYKNEQRIRSQTSSSYSFYLNRADSVSCAVKGYEDSPSLPVYAPKVPSVSLSPSGEIKEGSSVTLTCSSDANPAAKYTWYKKTYQHNEVISEGQQLVYSSIQSSDSGEYYCTAENTLGKTTSKSIFIDVTYAPKLPSVSVSLSGEIIEGSSVTLTCSSDANPAAKHTWYKKNVNPDLQPLKEPQLVFSSIQSSDSGEYYCTAENQLGKRTSEHIFIDVKYAPKLPSVSVSPSGEIVEGSSVNLTCSSDANPAANYTWYKDNEDSAKASGQIFTITDVRPEHSGNYYCEAKNRRGRHNSTLYLTVGSGAGKSIAAGVTTAVLLSIIILSVFLWMTKKRASNQWSEAEERPDNRERTQLEEQDNLHYASVHFSNNQADPLYSNIRSAQPHRHMEEQEVVQYAAVTFNRAGTDPRTRGQETEEDPAALYSTVNKSRSPLNFKI